jgi:uncharacterized protein (DUF2147 family)
MRPSFGSKQKTRALSGLVVSLGAAALMLTTGFSAVAESVKPPPAAAAAAAHVEGPLLTGFWQAYNDDGRPGGVFYFYEKNGLYEGRLVKAVTYPEEPPDDPLCKACTGEKKNQPMMGLVIVYGMKRHGAAKYEDGHILDPRDGKIWSAELDVTPDNKKLNLRGYIGTPLLGQTRVWTRLPDETMAPADIPGEPIAALGGVQGKKPAAATAGAPAAKPAAPKAQ